MKIGIDIRCLVEDRKTGVEEFTVGFLKDALENDKKNQFILFTNSFKNTDGNIAWLKKYSNVEIKNY